MGKSMAEIRQGIKSGLPIVVGYIPAAMAFGLLARTGGVSLLDTFLFSTVVFAGASQFMALNLLAAGTATGEIILATLLMNFRHFLMSASVAQRLKGSSKKWLPLVAFWMTDESFSVASLRQEKLSIPFVLTMQCSAYLAWAAGTILGFLIGSALPSAIQESMGVALYAMFVAILLPEAKKSVQVSILALGAGGIHCLLTVSKFFPSGWNLIIAIIIASLLGACLFPEEKEEEVWETA